MKLTKITILILLIIINCSFLFSKDNDDVTSDFTKDYSNDFAIGVGIIPIFYQMKFYSAWGVIESYDIDENTDEETFNDETEKLTGTPAELLNLGGGINFILSYSHYHKYNSSFGLTFSLGYLITPYCPEYRTIFMINNIISARILLLGKKGKPTNKVQFFYEIGLIANFEIPYYPYGKSADYSHTEYKYIFFIRTNEKTLYKYTFYYPDFMFGLGPYVDLGIEITVGNFNVALCIFSWITFGTVFDDAYQYLEKEPLLDNPRYNIVNTPIGFEVRLMYNKYY